MLPAGFDEDDLAELLDVIESLDEMFDCCVPEDEMWHERDRAARLVRRYRPTAEAAAPGST